MTVNSTLDAEREWTSVKERLPKDGGDYLCIADGCHMICEYFNVTKNWATEQESTADPEVTHWMPLPEPPMLDAEGTHSKT